MTDRLDKTFNITPEVVEEKPKEPQKYNLYGEFE